MSGKFNISLTKEEMILLHHIVVLSYDSILNVESIVGYSNEFTDFRRRIRDLGDKFLLEDFNL